MKIAEVEELIVQNGLSDELLEEFKLSLKRVPKILRCQHCYITAYNLRIKKASKKQKRKSFEDALRLIEYGIENHPERDLYLRLAYEHMGMAYGDAGEYEKAKVALQTACEIAGDSAAYTPYFAYLLVRMELPCSKFSYTPYLQELYDKMLLADKFESERRVNIFNRSLTEIIIAEHNGDEKAKKLACERAFEALDIRNPNVLDNVFVRHKALHLNTVSTTKEALKFLKKSSRKT